MTIFDLELRFASTENPPPLSKMTATVKGSIVRNSYVQNKICRGISSLFIDYLLLHICTVPLDDINSSPFWRIENDIIM